MRKNRPDIPHDPFWLRSEYGVVRIFTRRHIHGCKQTSPDHNSCSCPKWFYTKERDGRKRQLAAKTPSFTEAIEIARKLLKGYDPEIRAARKSVESSAIPIEQALKQYFEVFKVRGSSEIYIQGTIRPTFTRRPPCCRPHTRRRLNLSLLDWLDQRNRSAAEPIERLEQLTSHVLDAWASTWRTNDLSSNKWRTVAKGFFKWALAQGYIQRIPEFSVVRGKRFKRGNRCGYFSPEQYEKLIRSLPFYRPTTGHFPANYATRMRAFIELGRWAGMAISDLVRFSPAKNLAGDVVTYRRVKTREIAVVAIPHELAARLLSIPPEEGSSSEQPFCLPKLDDVNNRALWFNRFQRVCEFAGLETVETEVGTRRRPHPHMLRDTCAIDAILRGVPLDIVARMLGHATTEMTQKSYLFWIKQREKFSLDQQRAALAGVRLEPVVEAAPIQRCRPLMQ